MRVGFRQKGEHNRRANTRFAPTENRINTESRQNCPPLNIGWGEDKIPVDISKGKRRSVQ